MELKNYAYFNVVEHVLFVSSDDSVNKSPELLYKMKAQISYTILDDKQLCF